MTMADQIRAVTITTTPLIKAPRQTDQAVPLVSGHRQVAALAALVVLAVLAQGRCQAPSQLVTCTPTSLLLELVVAEVVLVRGAHTEETAGPEAPTRMEEASHLRDTAGPEAHMEDRRQVNTGLGHHHDQGRMDMPIIITAAPVVLVVLVVPAAPEDTTQKEWARSPHKLEGIQEESIREVPQVPKALETGQGHVQVLACRVPACRAPIEPAQLLQAKAKALHVPMCIARVLYRARLQHRRASLVRHRANRVPQRLKIWASHRVNRMVIA